MTSLDNELAALFLDCSRKALFAVAWPRIEECVAPLTEEQIWWRPNPASNSIGNLLLHLNGNVRQWIVDSFSKHADQRDRPAEFAAQSGLGGAELIARLARRSTKRPKFSTASPSTICSLLARFRATNARPRRHLPCRRALRHALRPDRLYHEKPAHQRYGLL